MQGDNSRTQGKGNFCHRKPLPSNDKEDVGVDTGVYVWITANCKVYSSAVLESPINLVFNPKSVSCQSRDYFVVKVTVKIVRSKKS